MLQHIPRANVFAIRIIQAPNTSEYHPKTSIVMLYESQNSGQKLSLIMILLLWAHLDHPWVIQLDKLSAGQFDAQTRAIVARTKNGSNIFISKEEEVCVYITTEFL